MDLINRVEYFKSKNIDNRLNSWKELFEIAQDFLKSNNDNRSLAKNIAKDIYSLRYLMGSSKSFEGATDIDMILLDISLPIARIGFEKSLTLIDFLKDAVYYSKFYPEKYNKEQLEQEIREIEQKNNQP